MVRTSESPVWIPAFAGMTLQGWDVFADWTFSKNSPPRYGRAGVTDDLTVSGFGSPWRKGVPRTESAGRLRMF